LHIDSICYILICGKPQYTDYERNIEMEKSCKLLKVVSILMIIFGSIALLVSLLAVAGAGVIAAGAAGVATDAAAAAAGLIMAAAVIMLVASVIQFVAGIVGVKNHNKPEKATICIVFGILVLIVYIVSTVISIVSGDPGALSIVISIISGLIMPVLYLLGAFKLKSLA